MKKTGQILREAREARGISLQEVSVHLKISSRILRALEEGVRADLPAKTFLRGFVQSYAQFLRLDGNEVLELFQAEMGTTHPKMITKQIDLQVETNKSSPIQSQKIINSQVSLVSDFAQATDAPVVVNSEIKKLDSLQKPQAPSLSVDHKTWSLSMKIGTTVIIIFIGGIIFGVIKTIEKYEKEAKVVQAPQIDLQVVPRTEVTPLISPLSTLSPIEPTPTVIEANSTPLPNTEGELKSSPNAVAETNSEAQTILPSAIPTPEISKVNETQSPAPEVSKSQEVIIEALDRVTIEYSIDDKPRATIVLSPEKVHTFKGEKKVSLSFSDGGSINLIYNGKDKGVPGNLGKPFKISFPE